MRILVTGAAGFIGAHLSMTLFREIKGVSIIGLDNLNDYYDPSLKKYRLEGIAGACRDCGGAAESSVWKFIEGDIADKDLVMDIFNDFKPEIVVNLAAQAGVRNSILNPDSYIRSNVTGFFNILEACRHSYDGGCAGVRHLVYASSSSVYGSNSKVPYSVSDMTDSPVSLYAATKKSDELMAYAYSKLYDIPATGLRFFTVYGPAGRPDMAYYSFADAMVEGRKFHVYNYGECMRDFTYIGDIVKGIIAVMKHAPERRKDSDGLPVSPHRIYNIGKGTPEKLMDFLEILGEELVSARVLPSDFDLRSHLEMFPMQPGDVAVTFADTSALEQDFHYIPDTGLREGLRKFALWYRDYYRL